MKIKDGYMLRNIVGTWIVVPLGTRTAEFNAMLTLNEGAAFIWKKLEQGFERDDLIKALLTEYEIDIVTAEQDLDEFLGKLSKLELVVI